MLLHKLFGPIIYANIAISQMLSQCMIFALQGAKNEILGCRLNSYLQINKNGHSSNKIRKTQNRIIVFQNLMGLQS